MNSAGVFGASLWSGYALPACHPENASPQRQPAEVPLINRGNLSRQSQPALSDMQDEIRTALPWVAAAVPLGTLSAANVAALEAREQFLVLNVLQVFGTMLFQMLPLAMAYWRGPSLDGLIAASIGGRLTASIPLILACWYYVPLRSRPSFRG